MDKRDQLLKAALRLFAKHGLAVSTAKIAAEARVATGTLFNYFPSKQALIDALYVQLKTELSRRFQEAGSMDAPTFEQSVRVTWTTCIAWALNDPASHRVMGLLAGADAISAEARKQDEILFQPFIQRRERAVRAGEIAPLKFDYYVYILRTQIGACIDYALERKLKGKALETHIHTGFDVFWRGMAR